MDPSMLYVCAFLHMRMKSSSRSSKVRYLCELILSCNRFSVTHNLYVIIPSRQFNPLQKRAGICYVVIIKLEVTVRFGKHASNAGTQSPLYHLSYMSFFVKTTNNCT